MKTILLSFVILFTSTVMWAQNDSIRPEKFLVAGNVGFNYSSSKEYYQGNSATVQNSIYVSGTTLFGYCLTSGLYVGLSLTGSGEKTTIKDSDFKSVSYAFYISPMLRDYFFRGLFGQFQVNLGPSKTEQSILIYVPNIGLDQWSTVKLTSFNYGFSVGAGYDVMLAKHVYLEPMISYSYNRAEVKEYDLDYNENGFVFQVGMATRF